MVEAADKANLPTSWEVLSRRRGIEMVMVLGDASSRRMTFIKFESV